jgi:hypothetical protein
MLRQVTWVPDRILHPFPVAPDGQLDRAPSEDPDEPAVQRQELGLGDCLLEVRLEDDPSHTWDECLHHEVAGPAQLPTPLEVARPQSVEQCLLDDVLGEERPTQVRSEFGRHRGLA